MQHNDAQLGKPATPYKNTKANIEALTGIAQGAIAYATDTDELGTYDGVSAWTWGTGGCGTWGSITGTLSSQTDLQTALDGKQAADSDLTTIAGLTPSNDDILQRKAGAWTNRTLAQLITDLGLGSLAFLSSLAHSALSGIGTNTHAQIDTFISTTAPATYAPIAKGVSNGDSHDHTGGDGASLKTVVLIGFHAQANTVAASTTSYLVPFIPGITTLGGFPMPPGTVKSLKVRQNNTQPASGSLVCTVQKGLVDTAITATAAAGSAAQVLTDNTHTVSFNDGDVLNIKLVNNATAASAQITYASLLIELTVYP